MSATDFILRNGFWIKGTPKFIGDLQKFSITFPNAPDLKSNISSILNRQMGIPETYLIDREGVLRQVKIGPFTSVDEIKAFISIAQ